MTDPQRIAVIVPNWLGDVVMATPALRAIRDRFAASEITIVGPRSALELLEGSGLAGASIEDVSRGAGLGGFVSTALGLRHEAFDLVVLLPNSFRSALLAFLGGARRIAGYSRDGRGWMLSDKLNPPRVEGGGFQPASMIDYYCELARHIGAQCSSRRMVLAATEPYESQATELLAKAGVRSDQPMVMLNPGASYGTSKMWEPARYAAVADALVQKCGAAIIINAAPSEREIAARVEQSMKTKPALNFARQQGSIGLLKSLMRRCRLLLTNDTGARHVAAAFGIGVVTIFGSTDPRWSDTGYERERIIRVDVECSPCQSKTCSRKRGPLYHQCMAAISPEMVLKPALELIGSGVGGRPL